jgi:hypothetical protein
MRLSFGSSIPNIFTYNTLRYLYYLTVPYITSLSLSPPPPSSSLPLFRLVYRWFLFIYQATYVTGIVGYIILLLIFTGIGLLLPIHPDTIMELGVTLIFYGVYFGVMGRDCAELCVDYMAAGMTVSDHLIAFQSQ